MIALALALLPCFFLMYKIYGADKIEKEPADLLGKIFLRGVISAVPAIILETIGTYILAYIGLEETTILYQVLMNFIVIAVSEEAVKRWAMKGPTWNNPEFNYMFDGVVYGVMASLGFAAIENVMYVMQFGVQVAFLRAVLSIPLHCICGIFMGYYYGRAKYASAHGDRNWMAESMRMSLLVPVLLHGFYDFCASIESETLSIIFLVFVIVLDIIAIKKVGRMSREDVPIDY
ncbi:MAG: PrsW family intramembrane metalloprotease [Lachnospiraceae bacterium]|nr:PrsW family intramembrane metalloprotease [Lachnospiraceae bacterium]